MPERWIPVEERLPENESEVLIKYTRRSISGQEFPTKDTGWYRWQHWFRGDGAQLDVRVTHWAPIQWPPEPEATDE